jgi:ribonuclease HII
MEFWVKLLWIGAMMKHYDNHQIENRLYAEGYLYIAGCDEVGRGPLVGPVCAGAVIMPKDCYIEGVTDSKQVSEINREKLSKIIKEKAIAWAVSYVSNEEIDEINIYQASKKAMMLALASLKVKPSIVLSDAMPLTIDCPNEAIIKGDAKSFTIACASIIAKVERDHYMGELAKKYPQYQYEKNKGYPTKAHLAAIEEYGITPLYRMTYGPVKKVIEKNKLNEGKNGTSD